MRTYTNLYKKSANTWIDGILSMMTKSQQLFNIVVDECDILIYHRIYNLCSTQMFVVVVPRNDQSFQTISEMWHEEVSNFCLPRDREWTDEQQEVFRQIADLETQQFSTMFETIGVAMDAESKGVRPHSKAMQSIFEESEIEQKRKTLDVQLQKDSLQLKFDNLEKSEIFVDSFDRTIPHSDSENLFFLSLPPKLTLLEKSNFDPSCFNVYGTKFNKKRGVYLVHTKRPQKWAKPFRIRILDN